VNSGPDKVQTASITNTIMLLEQT